MSKRVANCKGRSTARFGRTRYGWKASRMLSQLEKVEERLNEADLDEKLRIKYEDFKQRAKAILPKKLLQRHQGR